MRGSNIHAMKYPEEKWSLGKKQYLKKQFLKYKYKLQVNPCETQVKQVREN